MDTKIIFAPTADDARRKADTARYKQRLKKIIESRNTLSQLITTAAVNGEYQIKVDPELLIKDNREWLESRGFRVAMPNIINWEYE